jgi:hypothetical protein
MSAFRNNIEDHVSRNNIHSIVQGYITEYTHECEMVARENRPVCEPCLYQTEMAFTHMGRCRARCHCDTLVPTITMECIKCTEIKEEIQFIRSEIVRASTNYGIEVAASLVQNPLFSQTIGRMVVRARVLENILMHQPVTDGMDISVSSDNSDNISDISADDEQSEDMDESEYTEHIQIFPEQYEVQNDNAHDMEITEDEADTVQSALMSEECSTVLELSDDDEEEMYLTPSNESPDPIVEIHAPIKRGRALALADLYEGLYTIKPTDLGRSLALADLYEAFASMNLNDTRAGQKRTFHQMEQIPC